MWGTGWWWSSPFCLTPRKTSPLVEWKLDYYYYSLSFNLQLKYIRRWNHWTFFNYVGKAKQHHNLLLYNYMFLFGLYISISSSVAANEFSAWWAASIHIQNLNFVRHFISYSHVDFFNFFELTFFLLFCCFSFFCSH